MTALTLKDATYAGVGRENRVLQDDSKNSSRRGNRQERKARELVLWSHVGRHGREF